MKPKDKFFDDEYVNTSSKKKLNKLHNNVGEKLTDKLGNPIRLGDLTQIVLKDGTFVLDCEVIEINNGLVTVMEVVSNNPYDAPTYEVPANNVVVVSI